MARICDDKSGKVGGYLAVAQLLVAKGGDPSLYDNVRSSTAPLLQVTDSLACTGWSDGADARRIQR